MAWGARWRVEPGCCWHRALVGRQRCQPTLLAMRHPLREVLRLKHPQISLAPNGRAYGKNLCQKLCAMVQFGE